MEKVKYSDFNILIEVRNVGEIPSIVTGYKLKVLTPDGKCYDGLIKFQTNDLVETANSEKI